MIGASHSDAGLRSSGLGLPLGDLGDGCATDASSGLYGAPALADFQLVLAFKRLKWRQIDERLFGLSKVSPKFIRRAS